MQVLVINHHVFLNFKILFKKKHSQGINVCDFHGVSSTVNISSQSKFLISHETLYQQSEP